MRIALPVLALAMTGWAPADEVQAVKPRRLKLGGVVISGGYSHASGPYWWSYRTFYSPYSQFWDWAWYHPFFHPGFYYGFAHGPSKGEIRLRTSVAKAEVYLDGAFAGFAEDLKSMWLDPGAYNLEVRPPGRTAYSRRVYVLTGKILRLDAAFEEAKP